ncbi:uncharacterized protein LOC116286813 [Actinia tenebrosa]|uniref:Uncharacterized protein LOC116286813 n=1 Tax=Actinia tenebrosa TaxID=6105 RepID=A0A6P8GYG6_ACTTE|nr:uncharacterized protein LOC116286813 [Actinia tenebrosa]
MFKTECKGTYFCSKHLNPLELEKSSWSPCTIPCCVVCALKEQGVIYTIESNQENTARHSSDVVQGARETVELINESGTKTLACSKLQRRDTSNKDLGIINATFSSSRNYKKSEHFEKEKSLTDSSQNQEEAGKEDQSLTTSKIHAKKSSFFQPSIQDEEGLRFLGTVNETFHEIDSSEHNHTLEAYRKLHSTLPKRECQKVNSQIYNKNILEGLVLNDLPQLSTIEKFSSVLQSVMEGIENCSDLATNLTSDTHKNLAANPTEMSEDFVPASNDAMMASYSSFSFGEDYLGSSFKKLDDPEEKPVKIFDFAAEESERITEHPEEKEWRERRERDSKAEEKLQIDNDAKSSNNNTMKIGESKFERNFESPKEFNKMEPLGTPGNSGGSHRGSSSSKAEPHDVKESNARVHKQNGVRRNVSTKTDRGFKFFKRKIFSKSMKNSSTKNKSEGKGSPSLESFDGVKLTSKALEKEDGDKKVVSDAPSRITELENTIKQLENEKSNLEGEKLDLMNALSNIWIEMEDLKNSFDKDQGNVDIVKPLKEDKTTIVSFQEIGHDEDSSDVNKNKTSSFRKRHELCHQTQEEQSKVDLENQIRALNTKTSQSETLQSLRIKLSVINEDKENLSRKLNEMFEKNKVLEENLQKISGKTSPEVDKILEENLSFRSRLESLSRDKLLLEKNNQKLKIEKKKHKLMKLQIQKGCENLIHRINEVLQTTHAEKVNAIPLQLKSIPTSSKNNKSSFEKFSATSEMSSNVDKDGNSVEQIARKLERTNSIDSEVRTRKKIMKEFETSSRDGREERPPATVRRAETLNSKSFNSDFTDGKIKEMKVNRFPPTQSSRGDKPRKDLKSSSANEIGFRSTVPSDIQAPSLRSVTENEADPCLKFFEHLEAKCVLLLERFTVLNGKVEWLERNGDIYESMSPQGTYNANTQQSSPDEAASLDNVSTQNNQKDTVLLSCLSNLQKENDNLKLDNLQYESLFANMQNKRNENLSERMEDEVTTRRAEKDLHDLEIRVVPERDVELQENMVESDENTAYMRDNGEITTELNHSNNDFSDHQLKEEEDMSSWHRKHSKKESSKALHQNQIVPMKIRQATSLGQLPNLQDTLPKTEGDVYAKCGDTNTDRQAKGKPILRALSLGEGKTVSSRLAHQPTHPTNENLINTSPENSLQKHDQETIIAPDNVPNDDPVLNSQERCCQSFKLNGNHHENCSFILARLKKMTPVDEANTTAPPKTRENNKTLKKAMSTYGSRDWGYKVHYV